MREEFTCPVPGGHRFRNGDGPKILWNGDGTLTCSYDTIPVHRVMALDELPPDDDTLRELCTLLRENLSPDIYGQAEALLVHLMGGGPDVHSPDAVLNAASDEPAPFRGQPARPGIDRRFTPPLAGDSRPLREFTAWQKSFRSRFPTAGRVRQL